MGRSGGNGGMLRSVGRVVRAAGVGGGGGDPFSAGPSSIKSTHHKPTSANLRSLSSASSSDPPISITAVSSTWPSLLCLCDEWDWESVEAVEDEGAMGPLDDCVFGCVPSSDEVRSALSALQQVLDLSNSEDTRNRFYANSEIATPDHITIPTSLVHRVSSVGSDLDWKEPSPQTMLQTHGSHRVYDAFQLLQTDPSVQRMVVSLSSDKAVWDAVLNNEAVQELRESYCAADGNGRQSSDGTSSDPSPAVHILEWIFGNTKAKLMNLFEKITKLVSPLSRNPDGEKTRGGGAAVNPFEERLKYSLMISVVILLIVVVTRANQA